MLLMAPLLAVIVESAAFALGRPGLVALAEYWVGPVCHHLPERTLHLGLRPLPVCARCTGLYLGAAAGGLLGLLVSRRPLLPALVAGALLGIGLGGAAALVELAGLSATSNAARLPLGALLGLGPTLIGGLGARVLLDEGLRGRRPRG